MRVGVVASIVLAVGCGRAPPSTPTVDDATVLSILRDRTGVLDRGGFTWVAGAIDYFRQGTSRLREGRVKTLSDAEVRRRFEASDVLLVADVHDLDPIRRAFGRLVAEYGTTKPMATVWEAFPPEADPALDTRRNAPREELLAYLQTVWPSPVIALADVLATPAVRKTHWIGSGNPPGPVPPDYTPDTKRMPVITLVGVSVLEAKYGATHEPGFGRNGPTAQRIDAWLADAGPGARVCVLYGCAHLVDGVYPGTGIRAELRKRGRRAVIVVPFFPEWEIAVREYGGRAAARRWQEVLPDVYRAPLVSDREILALARH